MADFNFLRVLWSKAPLAWAIIRAVECDRLSKVNFTPPILEVGCGDGLVTQTLFNNKLGVIDIGIDLDEKELGLAKKTGVYKKLFKANICKSRFSNCSFATILANGVLEHIPDLDMALSEIARLLKPNGTLITTSPTDNFTHLLFYYRLLKFFKLPAIAERYGRLINHAFVHHHLLPLYVWRRRLSKVGLRVVKFSYYNNPTVVAIHDLCLPLSLGCKQLKSLTGSLVLFPQIRPYMISPLIQKLTNIITSPSDITTSGSILIKATKL